MLAFLPKAIGKIKKTVAILTNKYNNSHSLFHHSKFSNYF